MPIRLRESTGIEGFLGATQDVNLLRVHTARYRNGHSVMPPLAGGLTDQQIADIAAYVRGL